MKKTLIPIVVILLLVVGGAGVYVLVDTDGAMRFAGLKGPEQAAPPANAQPAASPAAGQQAGFDRRASGQDQRPPSRPPTREELQAAGTTQTVEETINIPISRSGRYVGPTTPPATVEPPRQELYPFSVRRRSYPDANTIAVEFAIRNSSGSHWRNAYITMRSERFPQAQLFQIEDWQIDETVGLEYRFPKDEVGDRLMGLRVIAISGDRRESALAALLTQDRQRYLEYALISSQTPQTRRREGERLTAPGLLGLVGQFQSPVTGIQVRPASFVRAQTRTLRVQIPGELLLPADVPMSLRETSEERTGINEQLADFHSKALAAQSGVESFVTLINSGTVQSTSEPAVQQSLQDLRRALAAFNASGERLARMVRLSRDTDVKRVESAWVGHSRLILGQLDQVESEIRRIDPTFRVQE